MEDYRSNSHKSKEDTPKEKTIDKRVEKVISGGVKSKKKTKMDEFKDVFISEDMNNVKSYILIDILIPAVKKAISDIVRSGIDMILYGDSGSGRKNSTSSKVSYRSYYDKEPDDDRSYSRSKSNYSYDDIILDTRGEAEDVLRRMDELIETYRMVSVADLYDLVGVAGNYTDNKYGWTSLRTASVTRVREGYMIKLPKALPLN